MTRPGPPDRRGSTVTRDPRGPAPGGPAPREGALVRRGLVGFPLVLVGLAALAVFRDQWGVSLFYLTLLYTLFFWVAQATSWNILSGYSGYFSFGQGAFVGVGVYTTAVLSAKHGWNFYATLPVAALLSALVGLGIGAVAFRLGAFRGATFALLTLAVPFILAALARLTRAIDGGAGVLVEVPELPGELRFQEFLYLVMLVIAVLAVATAYFIQHSRFGWALAAIRDHEDVAEGLGVATFRWKMAAIAATGALGGLAGSAWALQYGYVQVEVVFGLTVPLFVIVMSVLGGRTHWAGPVIGAAVIVLLQDRLADGAYEQWRLIIFGGLLAVMVIFAPDGLYAQLRARPRSSLAAGAATLLLLWALGLVGNLPDQVLVAMLVTAVVAFWPSRLTPLALFPALAGRVPGARAREQRWGGARLAPAAGPSPSRPSPSNPPPDHSSPERTSPEDRSLEPSSETPAPADPPSPSRPSPAGHGRVSAGTPAGPDTAAVAGGEGRDLLIECRDVARYFGGVRALDGVDLQIREGELVGLVGPNGSGKTTLVNLLSGAFRPSRGQIRVGGRDTGKLAPHRFTHAGITRTYQIPRPFESMTVRDNVAMALMFGRQPRTLAAARTEADGHLAFVGLDHLADARPADINLHQRQLLEMARALATSPKVLLLDEALAGLNPAEIDNAVQVVRRIHASGVTIVIVEHLLRVVNQLATRVVVLNRGTLLADGEPATVMSDPAVVRAYLGKSGQAGESESGPAGGSGQAQEARPHA